MTLFGCGDSDPGTGGAGGSSQTAGGGSSADGGAPAGGQGNGGALIGGEGGASATCAETSSCPGGSACRAHSDCASSVCAAALCTAPLGIWTFNGNFASEGDSPIVLMASGTPPTLVPTQYGMGAEFAENSGHLMGGNSDFNLVVGDFTILARVRFAIEAFSDDVIVAKTTLNASGSGDGWSFLRHSDGLLSWCYSGAVGDCLDMNGMNKLQSVNELTDAVWYDVAVTRDASSYRLFIDGAQEQLAQIQGQIVPSPQPMHVGRDNSPSELVGQLGGVIDHLLIVPAAMTATEIETWQPPP